MSNFAELAQGDGDANFLVRWRGRQEGPYPSATIAAKLAAREFGLLHEIYCRGQWITIRDYISQREAALQVELQAREVQVRQAREVEEKKARVREEQLRTLALEEEKRKNDLLAANLLQSTPPSPRAAAMPATLKPHRGGMILALGLVGLVICGPLCLFAWAMGNGDLHEMDAGLMDSSGRSETATGRTCGLIGAILWIIGVVLFFLLR